VEENKCNSGSTAMQLKRQSASKDSDDTAMQSQRESTAMQMRECCNVEERMLQCNVKKECCTIMQCNATQKRVCHDCNTMQKREYSKIKESCESLSLKS